MTSPQPGIATGVRTNGEGQKTEAHLNLTVTLKEWAADEVRRDTRSRKKVRMPGFMPRDRYRNRFSTKRAIEGKK